MCNSKFLVFFLRVLCVCLRSRRAVFYLPPSVIEYSFVILVFACDSQSKNFKSFSPATSCGKIHVIGRSNNSTFKSDFQCSGLQEQIMKCTLSMNTLCGKDFGFRFIAFHVICCLVSHACKVLMCLIK